jgi:hypothetical protein
MRNKLLKPTLSAAMLLAAASILAGQDTTTLSGYQGPGILSPGVGDIGSRSGQQLDLRYYAGVSGVVDTNLQPVVLDAHGNLLRVHNLYGIEVHGGVYGVHSWKRSQLGLDYVGSYHKYFNEDVFNGSDHSLALGFTHERSRHFRIDLRESAGTFTFGTSQVADAATSGSSSAVTPTTILFDNRTYFLETSAFATWIQSARMSYTFGGTAFLQDRQAQGLGNTWGYNFTGKAIRRLSKTTSVGATFVYSHFEFPLLFSNSDSEAYHAFYATTLGRFWTFSIEAGATVTDVTSQITVPLDPTLAALLGQSTITGISFQRTIYPSGEAKLSRDFRRASLVFSYMRGLNSGNGVYSSARIEDARVAFSYTGVRRLNVGLNGGHDSISAIGQNLAPYALYFGSAGLTYELGHSIHLSMRYDLRDQQIDLPGYRRTSTRASVGLIYSPGNVPLSLW